MIMQIDVNSSCNHNTLQFLFIPQEITIKFDHIFKEQVLSTAFSRTPIKHAFYGAFLYLFHFKVHSNAG